MYMYIAIYSYIKNAEYAHRRVFSANRVAAKGSLRSPHTTRSRALAMPVSASLSVDGREPPSR